MWIDGVQHKNKQDNQYKEASSVLIPPNSRVIAVQCQDVGGKEGLIGSTSTGIMTGQAGWVCTAREQSGKALPFLIFTVTTEYVSRISVA